MQRNRFETYRGRLRFKPDYRLYAVKGSIVVWGKSLVVLSLWISFNNVILIWNALLWDYFKHVSIEYN